MIGAFARDQMTALPGRVIHSAKSWLAHGGVDREAQILPFASEEIPTELRLSPVEASAAYLDYLKQAWDQAFARGDAAQRIRRAARRRHGAGFLRRGGADPDAHGRRDGRLSAGVPAAGGTPGRLLCLARRCLRRTRPARGCSPVSPTSRSTRNAFSSATWAAAPPTSACSGSRRFAPPRISRRSSASPPATICCWAGTTSTSRVAHALERLFKPGTDERVSRQQWSHLVPQARLLKERVLEQRRRSRRGLSRLDSGRRREPLRGCPRYHGDAGARPGVGAGRFLPVERSRSSCRSRAGSDLREIGLPVCIRHRHQPASRGVPQRAARGCGAVRRRHAASAGDPGAPARGDRRLAGQPPCPSGLAGHEPRDCPGRRAFRGAGGGSAGTHTRRLSPQRLPRAAAATGRLPGPPWCA